VTIEELVAFSSSLDPDEAERLYGLGVFPMPLADGYGWFYPETRAVVVLGAWPLRCPRSTLQLVRVYRVGIDLDPMAMVKMCSEVPRDGGWIDASMIEFYAALNDRGLLHSIEVRGVGDELVGGLFGVGVGGIFMGESMVHQVPNASKLAFFALAHVAHDLGYQVIDGQWPTDHLTKLGFRALPGDRYATLLTTLSRQEPGRFERGYLKPAQLRLRHLR
jgi:leucyl/phenylalanyl-tRNA--protein transferase